MSRYLTSIIEQALWSLLNLGVTLLLAKLAAPAEFGTFIFWSSTAYVLSSVQNALTLCHLQVLPPAPGTDPARREVERLMLLVTFVFLGLVTAGVLVLAFVLGKVGTGFGTAAAAVFVPAYLLQQYVRFVCFSRGEAITATVQTGAVLVLAASLLGLGYLLFKPLDASEILALLGAAYGLVGVGGLIRAFRGLAGSPDWRALLGYGAYVKQSGWIFLGVTSSELLARFYVFAIGGAYGNAILALLSFSQTFLRPIPLLALAWSMVGRNDLVRRREAGDWAGFARMLMLTGLGGIVVAAVWSGIVFAGWPLITERLFDGRYLEAQALVLIWGVAAAMGFFQTVLSTGLQTLKAFKVLALANAGASLAAAGAILLAMQTMGHAGAVVGTAIGQGLEALAMGVALVVLLRRLASPAADRYPSR